METNKVAYTNEGSKPAQERIHRANAKFLTESMYYRKSFV